MTESQTFFTFLMLLSFPFWMPKLFRKYQQGTPEPEQDEETEEEEQEEMEIDIEELADAVDQLQNQINEIRKLMGGIEKIDSCEPGEHHSNFIIKWQSEDGRNQTHEFWANGDSPTNDMLRELYQAEIDSLTTPLPDMTEKIYDLTHAE